MIQIYQMSHDSDFGVLSKKRKRKEEEETETQIFWQ